jgi:hypothetical protein
VTDANYSFVYDTTTQAVITANTFQNITFNTNGQLNGWTHSTVTNTQNFTCNQTGLYLINYTTVSEDTTAGTNITESFIALKNGTEIPGTQIAVDFDIAGQVLTQSKTFIGSFTSGDVLTFQFTAAATTCELVAGTGNGTTKPSASITIVRIS